MKRLPYLFASLFAAALVTAEPPFPSGGSPLAPHGAMTGVAASLRATGAALARTPLAFESNEGQADARVRYLARSRAATLFLTNDSAVWRLADGPALRLVPVGGRADAAIHGESPLPGHVNLFYGPDPKTWRRGIATYAHVRYENIVPGFDWLFYGRGGTLEYDVIVQPGADPRAIRLRWEGADSLSVTEQGELVARIGEREVRQNPPVVYQTRASESVHRGAAEADPDAAERTAARNPDDQERIAGNFVLFGGNEFGFEVGAYDPARELVIDPTVIFSTYLGGGAADNARALAIDSEDSIYIAGWTASANFPTMDPLQALPASNLSDVFVTKLSQDGSTLHYSTYLGGAAGEQAYDIAVDSEGSAYVVGNAGTNFPVTPGAFQPVAGNVSDAFVAKLSPDGSELVYSTFLGGGRADDARGVAVDQAGYAYVTGRTASDNFPVTPGSFGAARAMLGNTNDAWVAKINPTGSGLAYSGYLGGSGDETGAAIAVRDFRAFVTGSTASTNFPTTEGALSRANAGTTDIFLSKINPAGSGFEYSTYVGGSNVENAAGIDVDVLNNAYVTGSSVSTDFPTTPGAFQTARVFSNEIVVFKVNPAGSQLVYSTYIGTSSQDRAGAIAVDRQGHAHITGETFGDDFPAVNALQAAGGGADSFVTKLNFAGSALLYSSPLGGSGAEQSGREDSTPYGKTIAVNEACEVFVTGITDSTNFPTEAPFQAALAGSDDAFAAKFNLDADDGAPGIFCNGAVLAPLLPTVRRFAARSMATVFGRNFADTTNINTQLDSAGLVATNLAGVCVEVSGVRGPVFHVFGGQFGQVSFGFPVSIGPGWHDIRVIRACDTATEKISEPQFVLVEEVAPEMFNFLNTNPNGVNPIAAYNETDQTYVGPAGLFGGGPAQAVSIGPASPGDYVSVYPTGMGATNPPLLTGQIPGGLFHATAEVEVRLGDRVIPPADILYAGAAPCCAALDQVTFRVPLDMPAGQHPLLITADGVASPSGPFLTTGP